MPASTAKAFSDARKSAARAERYLKSNQTRAEAQKADLPKLQAEAKAAPTGNELIALGMAQFSFGQYPEAVAVTDRRHCQGQPEESRRCADDAGRGPVQGRSEGGGRARPSATSRPTTELTQRIAKLWALHAGG